MKILYALCFFLVLNACSWKNEHVVGNGNEITQERIMTIPSSIAVLGSMDVELMPTDEDSKIVVSADENLHPYILTEIEDGKLKIKMKDNISITTQHSIKIKLYLKGFKKLTLAGSGNVYSETKFLLGDEANISVSGSGNASLLLNAETVDLDITGSGNVLLQGECKKIKANIVGSGDVNGEDLMAETADVKIVGSGDAKVFADVLLEANIIGSGDVYYKGAAQVKSKITGSGSLKKLE